MAEPFDSDAIAKLGWRQGSILGTKLVNAARRYAPKNVVVADADCIIVTSHDCDIVNASLDKEPVVEVLRTTVSTAEKVDKQKSWGRNPRTLQVALEINDEPVLLSCSVHDRWLMPREVLLEEAPAGFLPEKERRLIAEWLAKRYIRAAFPTAFDRRWRSKLKEWQRLLKKHSEWLQGVYLRVSTLEELPPEDPYRCHLILAVPSAKVGGPAWAAKRSELQGEFEKFWEQFDAHIECAGVEPLGTNEITLADIEAYQRFDADWVSFEDDTAVTLPVSDMSS